ncbi:rRNA-binding endoribonuclease [Lachancea thermotolerans CBS 6340]|uniref:20S-pre-rRNA D-site endonuclease NOB1 n=1 Tax=Lachancea thermotolerans (strain ATCC 56472 / CBS 6340 / NRRL Y-8284) TaxID=559295 RepID=C5DJL2_LACTC|nr:KLTH0F17336p [Lachancea thermotolerans CBS 6340]CAR24501.1 KLTH0F17336p [Lachancea thermotolerans CBS 6340]
MSAETAAHVNSLVLDATPLITQSYSHYQSYAKSFFTTPTVFQEIKDEQARKNLELWRSLGTLELRHPKAESIKRVKDFAMLTGDYAVLSANDIHIIALTYELEVELNGGDWRLRTRPGDDLAETAEKEADQEKEVLAKSKKKRRRGGKKQREKRQQQEQEQEQEQETQGQEQEGAGLAQDQASEPDAQEPHEDEIANSLENLEMADAQSSQEAADGSYFEDDDDGEWINPENLTEVMIKDSGEDTKGTNVREDSHETTSENHLKLPQNQVALATGDFAVQNVALQMNLNLMNFLSGLKIRKLRNYMLRCHACFKMLPLPKDGTPKHFCPSCGGYSTLMRCAVSVDAATGDVTPHLKANFQWNNRGNRYSIASPLSKNSQKRFGKKGFVHSKHAQTTDLLREDQKEYEKALKQEDWTRRHNEKILNDWIGGGSAENFISPFAISGLKHHSVKVGRGRHANSSRKKK